MSKLAAKELRRDTLTTTSRAGVTAPTGSLPIRAPLQAMIPGVTVPVIPTTKNTRYGRGMLVPITVAASTPKTVQHNLGRIVQLMLPMIHHNLGPALGSDYPPRIKKVVGQDDTQFTTIETDAAATNLLVWML